MLRVHLLFLFLLTYLFCFLFCGVNSYLSLATSRWVQNGPWLLDRTEMVPKLQKYVSLLFLNLSVFGVEWLCSCFRESFTELGESRLAKIDPLRVEILVVRVSTTWTSSNSLQTFPYSLLFYSRRSDPFEKNYDKQKYCGSSSCSSKSST